jgi:hypothetical protein
LGRGGGWDFWGCQHGKRVPNKGKNEKERKGEKKKLGCKIRNLDRMRRHNNKKEEQIMGTC